MADCADHHAQCRCRLAFALARVHDKQTLFDRLGRDDLIMGGLLLFHLLGVLLFRSFSHFHAPANAASVTPPPFDLPHTRRQADAKAPVTTHPCGHRRTGRSEEHTSELQSLMRNSYAVFCLKKKKKYN